MKKKGKKFKGFLTVIVVIAIAAALGLTGWFGYESYNKYAIDKRAEEICDTFDKNIEEKLTEERLQRENEEAIANGEDVKTRRRSARTDYTTRYNDCIVVGTIRIPAINAKYPIMQEVSVEALEIGVAIAYTYGPGGLNQVGNTVIYGHNYRNGTFFAKIGKLSEGKSIFIKDESGEEVEYEVYKVFSAGPTESGFYKRDTEGKREITLSTCNKDGSARTVVLAVEK